MADALTTILRPTGEAPDATLHGSCIVQAFARAVLCLHGFRRGGTLRGEGRRNTPSVNASDFFSELRAELAARLDLIAEPAVAVAPVEAPLVAASRLMLDNLHLPASGSELLAGTALSPASSGDDVCCRQVGYLVSEALSAFARIPPPANGVVGCGSDKPVLAAGPVGSKPLRFGAVARYLARIFRHRLRALRGAGCRGVGVRPSAS